MNRKEVESYIYASGRGSKNIPMLGTLAMLIEAQIKSFEKLEKENRVLRGIAIQNNTCPECYQDDCYNLREECPYCGFKYE